MFSVAVAITAIRLKDQCDYNNLVRYKATLKQHFVQHISLCKEAAKSWAEVKCVDAFFVAACSTCDYVYSSITAAVRVHLQPEDSFFFCQV